MTAARIARESIQLTRLRQLQTLRMTLFAISASFFLPSHFPAAAFQGLGDEIGLSLAATLPQLPLLTSMSLRDNRLTDASLVSALSTTAADTPKHQKSPKNKKQDRTISVSSDYWSLRKLEIAIKRYIDVFFAPVYRRVQNQLRARANQKQAKMFSVMDLPFSVEAVNPKTQSLFLF